MVSVKQFMSEPPVTLDSDSLATLGSYASSPRITVTPSRDMREAAHIMAEMKVRRLVVVQDGKPIGIFTAADLAKAVGKLPLDL